MKGLDMKRIAVYLVSSLFAASSFALAGTPNEPVVISDPTQGQTAEQQSAQEQMPPNEPEGSVAVELADSSSLQAIHIANIALIKAGGFVLLRPTSNETKAAAWSMLVAHSKDEIKNVVLAREWKVNLFEVTADLAAWKAKVEASLALIKNSSKDEFEAVYQAQVDAINTGLIETLDHSLTMGFTHSNVESFVKAIYAQAQVELGIEAAPAEATTE